MHNIRMLVDGRGTSFWWLVNKPLNDVMKKDLSSILIEP
jgi:hypothetical protein